MIFKKYKLFYFAFSEVTQDFTSKGLALVYENCSAEQKNTLVQELVETLMTGKRYIIHLFYSYYDIL